MRALAGPLSHWFAKGDPAEADRLVAGVEQWRKDLRSSVAEKVGEQLVWDERSGTTFAADLDEAGHVALRLFAFYAERSDLEWPDTCPALCELDAAWREGAEQKFAKSLYGQILACDMWLPGEFPVTVRAPRPDGQAVEIGSLQVLLDQLNWLNQRTFQADEAEVVAWQSERAAAGIAFVAAARRGFASLLQACKVARDAALPLMLEMPEGAPDPGPGAAAL
ncbi:MAG: hypothetical protein AB8H80_14325 [Planctomycetota bacterium]